MDRTHAFAAGRVYAEPSVVARFVPTRRATAWRSFRRSAVLGNDCLLGPSAWCANPGAPDAIRLGSRVVCRGLVRREPFGDGRVTIGDDVYIGDDCVISCAERIEIGNGVLLAHGVQIFDNNSHPVDPTDRAADWRAVVHGGERRPIASAAVRIGEGAWIGFGSFVLKGVTIGARAIIGAGSVVTHDVGDGIVAAGNPARVLDQS